MTFTSSVSPLSNTTNPKIVQSFDARTYLPLRQQHLWQLESGSVRTLTYLEDGTPIVLGLWGPGDFVGKALAKANPYEIECLTKVKAIPLAQTDSHQLTEILLAHLQQLEELTVIRSHKKTEFMILNLLSWLAQKFGRAVQSGQLIDLRLTHQDIAETLGSTRVTVTRMLSQLEQQGMIDRLPLHRIVLREDAIWHYEI
jgi:CRP-like cAMP-binding protein